LILLKNLNLTQTKLCSAKLAKKIIRSWKTSLLCYKYSIKLVDKVTEKCKWEKNKKIIIYLKRIIRKIDKYIKDKKYIWS